MPMKLKSTQFNLVNKEECPWDESKEWSAIMEEGVTLFSQEELQPEFYPSDQSVKNIMDFARSYQTVQVRSMKFIDLHMN